MTIAKHIAEALKQSSWIRRMFEEGAELKARHGAEKVFDFSIGNPNVPPPPELHAKLIKILSNDALDHSYMPNAGYAHVRKAIAEKLAAEHQVNITGNEVIMTCGAAGALNVIFKTILNPGDEVIIPVPYFVEYNFYVGNHGGIAVHVPTKPDFMLDVDAVANAVSPKTKAVLINTPHNPTGQVYSKSNLDALSEMLRLKSSEFGSPIYLLCDDPYRKIIFDDISLPSVFQSYAHTIIATSFSKDLSIPGERIGYIAVNPQAEYKKELLGGMVFANRVLGFVNAPALIQRVIAELLNTSADISQYARKRELICNGLAESGYEFNKPAGTFYVFPKSPVDDEIEFINALQQELILTVPGRGFGAPGFFRIAFCVDDKTIINALPGFKRAMAQYK